MSDAPKDSIAAMFGECAAAHQRFAVYGVESVIRAADAIRGALASRHKILAFGNGGSASDAEHFVAELVGRFDGERHGLPAVALTAHSGIMTAVANDYGYERVFSRQIEALGLPGDIALGISTSGRSPNIVAALAAARSRGLITIALTGRDGGPAGAAADIHVNVAEPATPRIQEVHRTILHAICQLVDQAVRGQG